jgi:putative lipoprotein (rSAM/lipoprotein system)
MKEKRTRKGSLFFIQYFYPARVIIDVMKIKFLKLKNWLLVSLMGALGFSACNCHKKAAKTEVETDSISVQDRGEIRLMYGVPTMDFQVRGKITDANGKPISGIKVNMLERGMELQGTELQGDPERVKDYLEKTAATTDKRGHFELQNSGTPQEQVRLLVRDVDGNANGLHKDRLVEVEVTPDAVDRTNASGWYQGTFNKEVGIQLEDK